jgi:molybdenum cofactor cytidylyltransferase
MKFGATALDEAAGAILVHTLRRGRLVLKKGRVLTAKDIAALQAAGVASVVAARLEADDVGEDAAAARIARAVAGENLTPSEPFTGRCNLVASAPGVAVLDPARIERINLVHEAATLATVAPYEAVEAGQIVATVKIVTFAVPETVIADCGRIAAEGGAPVRVAAYRPVSVGLIQTRQAGDKATLLDKAVEVTRQRLAPLGATLDRDLRTAHDPDQVAAALRELSTECDIVLVLGSSAIVDRRDVVPAAVELIGGTVEHLGMPVDPGHLTLFARIGAARVLGLPGSARSPRPHGFDKVLRRLAAGIEVTPADIARMGVGGLLKDIPGRPAPRASAPESPPRPPRVAALVLAAGQSRRMGPVNKLLAEVDGRPMVAHAVDAALASKAQPVVVVTGHEPERVRAALAGRNVTFAHNALYAEGLSGSLRAGLDALPADIDGVVICLGDMPSVAASHIDRLIAAFDPAGGRTICVPTFNGKRGNPVLWARRYFAEMREVAGDVGARHLIGAHADEISEVAMADTSVLEDLDTPDALAAHIARRQNREA